MSNKIEHKDIYEDDLFKNANDSATKLLGSIENLLKGFKGLGKEALRYSNITVNNSKDIKDLNHYNGKANKLINEIIKLEQQKARLQAASGKVTQTLKTEVSELNLALRQ